MKVLIVCSGNWGYTKPFISEQVDAIRRKGIEADYFLIVGKGVWGYIKNLPKLRQVIKKNKYDLVHAHYGLSGLLAVMQRRILVVVTFHGVDLIDKTNEYCRSSRTNKLHVFLSKLAARFSAYNIFVNKSIAAYPQKAHSVISCGVDLTEFSPMDKESCREKLNLAKDKNYILFVSSFDYGVRKNYTLAKASIGLIENAALIELKNYSRKDVNLLMNACDMLLVTSHFETGPQVVKEAMACNCPVVSTDVGDVKEIINTIDGCYITSFRHQEVAEKIKMALAFGKRTNGRERIVQYDNNSIADKITDVYKKVLAEK